MIVLVLVLVVLVVVFFDDRRHGPSFLVKVRLMMGLY